MSFSCDDHTGCLAFSVAGHDKGRLYVVVGMFDDHVLLSDGRLRKLSLPKKKNLKHVMLVKKERLCSEQLNDIDIKRVIKMFLAKGSNSKDGKETD